MTTSNSESNSQASPEPDSHASESPTSVGRRTIFSRDPGTPRGGSAPPAALAADSLHDSLELPTPMTSATGGWLVALLGWTLILCFYGLSGGADFEVTDCWVAQTAREMHEAGDWLVPRFSGETRMQKSPGAYWAVMGAAVLMDRPVDEFTARLPNAVAAVMLVLIVFWLTRHIAGDRAAIFAGFTASSSVLVLYWSHRGASDLGLAALIALSLSCLWIGSQSAASRTRRVLLWLIGYTAAGAAMLYKMPVPLACIGLPAFFYLLLRNRWRILASPWHVVGVVLFLAPWLPWAAAVFLNEPMALDKWRTEFVDRFLGTMPNVQHQKHWRWYLVYFLPLAIYTLPFSFSIPAAIVRGFRRQPRVRRDGAAFVLIWFISHFVFFTVAAGKEFRYLLPALPPVFVLLGIELAVLFDPNRRASPVRERLAAWAVWLLMPAALGGGAYGLYRWCERRGGLVTWSEVWRPYVVVATILVVGASIAAALFVRRRRNASFGALVSTMYVLWFAMWPMLMPKLTSAAPYRDFA
ncbi:MAG: glycosyltransferase family 39 protein, partial [Phycisphaerae bacterium]